MASISPISPEEIINLCFNADKQQIEKALLQAYRDLSKNQKQEGAFLSTQYAEKRVKIFEQILQEKNKSIKK